MRPPTLALIFAPMPSRLDLYFCEAEEEKDMPTVLSAIQWFPLRASLTNSIGGAFMLLITADMRPSFHKSPTASPRDELSAVTPGPAPAEMSANVPLPLLRSEERRVGKSGGRGVG